MREELVNRKIESIGSIESIEKSNQSLTVMKLPAMTRFLLVGCCLVLGSLQAFAFQLADGAAPAPVTTAKYIFYWEKNQCALTQSNDYQGHIELSATSFRQMLLSAPKLWNGHELLKDLHFSLEGYTISTLNYLGQLAELDARLGPLAVTGNTLNLTDLLLDDGKKAAIRIQIKEDTEKPPPVYGFSPAQDQNQLNTQWLDRVVWGREDIYETSDRDFFTVQEFWQTIRQEPLVEWNPYVEPQTIRIDVRLTSAGKTSMGVVANLAEMTYSDFLTQLETYRYMVHPGATISLNLQTAAQYDQLFKKTMLIVGEQDPRLRLRRKRDQHTLSLRWGEWYEKINGLYLQNLITPQDDTLSADRPISRNSSMTFTDGKSLVEDKAWLSQKPVYTIDGEPVSGELTMRVTVSDTITFWVNTRTFESDSLEQYFKEGLFHYKMAIDSIQIEGFDLPPMTFTMYMLMLKKPNLVGNTLEDLEKETSKFARVRLESPVRTEKGYQFGFQIPDRAYMSFSVFEPDGWNSYVWEDVFPSGSHQIEVPFKTFRNKGKHLAFLNSSFGVVKVVFEVE